MEYKILNKKRNSFYFVIFIVGLWLLVWEINLFRKTIIDFKIPILIIFITGTIAYFIDRNHYKSTYDISNTNISGHTQNILCWIQNICSWGFIICTLFMVTNKYFADEDSSIKEYKIDNVSDMPGAQTLSKRQPLVRIDFDGVIKELVFSNKYLNQINDYSSVELETRKGFFGYYIITNQELKK